VLAAEIAGAAIVEPSDPALKAALDQMPLANQ